MDKDLFEQLVELAPDGVIVTGADGAIVLVNRQVEVMLGYAREELRGHSVEILTPERFRDQHADHRHAYLANPQTRPMGRNLCILCRRKDGTEFPADIQLAPVGTLNGLLIMATIRDITERKQLEARLQYLAHHDPLTDLPNRQLFLDRLAQALAHARRERETVGLLFIDLDNFKAINDIHGHQVGDRVLRAVATRLTRSVRANDTVARLGGDEFACILEGLKAPRDAARVAHKILAILGEPFLDDSHQQHVIGASIGIGIYPDTAIEADELLMKADAAMYRAKAQGDTFRFAAQPVEDS